MIDAHLVSARTGDGLDACSSAIMRERKGRDTFILGAANVGKSLFVGSFLEHALGARSKRLPISSSTPGTTLKLIGVDCFEGGSMLFDTPGLHLAHRLSASLLPEGAQSPQSPQTPPSPHARPIPWALATRPWARPHFEDQATLGGGRTARLEAHLEAHLEAEAHLEGGALVHKRRAEDATAYRTKLPRWRHAKGSTNIRPIPC